MKEGNLRHRRAGSVVLLVGTALVRGFGQPAQRKTAPAPAKPTTDRPADGPRSAKRPGNSPGRSRRATPRPSPPRSPSPANTSTTTTRRSTAGRPWPRPTPISSPSGSNLKLESKSNKVRFVGQDTAVEEGTFTAKAKDQPTRCLPLQRPVRPPGGQVAHRHAQGVGRRRDRAGRDQRHRLADRHLGKHRRRRDRPHHLRVGPEQEVHHRPLHDHAKGPASRWPARR